MLCQLFQRHTIQPAHKLAKMAQAVIGRLFALQQAHQFFEVFAQHSMARRLAYHPGLFEPLRGAQMQPGHVDV
ncbi:hypothetical protein D3C81_1384260 [compost metagenome]